MFQKLSTRLWLTYLFLIGTVVCVIAVGFMVYLIQSPAAIRQLAARLETIANLVQASERISPTTSPERLLQIANRLEANNGARIIFLNPDRQVIFDSRAGEAAELPNRFDRPRLLQGVSNSPSQFVDSDRQTWIYVLRPLQDGYSIIVAAPRPNINRTAFFRDEFLKPFFQAGIIALIVSVFLSIAITRWISKPLETIVASVRENPLQITNPIRVQGPNEVRQLAIAFNEMIKKVQASHKSQRDFVANVSHDLKTPLTSIQGFAQAIMEGTVDTPDQIKSAAQVIYSESGRMNRMVQDLLELARLDSGIANLEREPLEIHILIKEILSRFEPFIREKQIQLDISKIIELPTVIGDPDRLDRVFSNLLENAIKFTPSGGSIVVATGMDDHHVTLSIRDSGPGISDEEKERIFDRFYQADKMRSNQYRGAGLGLTIAREIVLAHSGEIHFYNNKDLDPGSVGMAEAGTTFTISLPIIRPDDSTLVKRRGLR